MSIFSAAGSLVDSPSATQENEPEQTMIATSGMRCYALYEKYTRLGSLVKTLVASPVWKMATHLSGYCLTWRVKGTKYNRCLYQLRVSERGTGEKGFGLLATLVTMETRTDWTPEQIAELQQEVKETAKNGNGFGMNLSQQVKAGFLPTASSRDWKDTPGMSKTGINPDGSERKREDQLGRVVQGTLNPDFVEWMMGFPVGHTKL